MEYEMGDTGDRMDMVAGLLMLGADAVAVTEVVVHTSAI